MSTDYYTKIEQGAERTPSPQVLRALGAALHLDESEVIHVLRLAGAFPQPRTDSSRGSLSPTVACLLESSSMPTLVLDDALDVLGRNSFASDLFTGFQSVDNLARMTFTDPYAASFYVDLDRAREATAGHLRWSLGARPDDERLRALVAELHEHSERFRRLWARHTVEAKTRGTKIIRHPTRGVLSLNYELLEVSGSPGQYVAAYRPTDSASTRPMSASQLREHEVGGDRQGTEAVSDGVEHRIPRWLARSH